jgi:hypothetical protein
VVKRRPAAKSFDDAMQLFRDWGRTGGKIGGKARWKGLTAEERREVARKAARARWRKARDVR